MIKVAAVDLDGTLLRSNGTVSPATVKALAQAIDSGIKVVIVTARPPRVVKLLASEAGISGIAVCSNGAVVYDLDRDVATVRWPLAIDIAKRAATAAARVMPGAAFAIETGWQAFTGPGYGHTTSHDFARVPTDDLWASAATCVKLLAWSPAPVTDTMIDTVAAALPPEVTVTYSGGKGMLEIQAAGVSKVATLDALCQQWEVQAAQVAAFGDMPNDLPVLQWAGLAVAVANAHPRVLAIADEVTASNDDDGVSLVLNRWTATQPGAR